MTSWPLTFTQGNINGVYCPGVRRGIMETRDKGPDTIGPGNNVNDLGEKNGLLDYEIFGTGSKGNAVRVGDILLDCGVKFDLLHEALFKVNYLLITHRHGDHVHEATLRKITRLFPHIIVLANVEVAYLFPDHIDMVVNNGYPIEHKGRRFIPFDCPHGGVLCSGYVFNTQGYDVIYATDTSSLDDAPNLKYDYFFIEANYDERKLEAMDNAKKQYGYDVLQNSLRHLSKQQSKTFYYLHRKSRDSVYVPLHKSSRFY